MLLNTQRGEVVGVHLQSPTFRFRLLPSSSPKPEHIIPSLTHLHSGVSSLLNSNLGCVGSLGFWGGTELKRGVMWVEALANC